MPLHSSSRGFSSVQSANALPGQSTDRAEGQDRAGTLSRAEAGAKGRAEAKGRLGPGPRP